MNRKLAAYLLFSCFCAASVAGPAVADSATVVGRSGRIKAVSVGGERIPVGFNLYVFRPGWREMATLNAWDVQEGEYRRDNGRETWINRVEEFRIRHAVSETVVPAGVTVEVTLRIEALRDAQAEGVFLFFPFGVERFAGGTCVWDDGGDNARRRTLPERLPSDHRVASHEARALRVSSADKRVSFKAELDGVQSVTLQDNRRWNTQEYSLFTPVLQEGMKKGDSQTCHFTLTVNRQHSQNVAHGVVDDDRTTPFTGFGGNFVYQRESPVTAFNHRTLNPQWARCGMTLREWEPENDNGSAETPNWQAFRGRDATGSELRAEFEWLRRFARRGIPLCVSIWRLPEWLYRNPGDPAETFNRHGRRLADGAWPELLECIGTYLEHAKRVYGAEPDLLSFNEPDGGWQVKMSARQHAQFIAKAGRYLAARGLQTKLILGDCAHADGMDYVLDAMGTEDIVGSAGALAFHSWNASTEAYAGWRRLARRTQLPLLVTESGVDPQAWRYPWMLERTHYALDELRMIQDLLRVARPQSIMQWEFTPDYRMAFLEDEAVQTTLRWHFWRHFACLTPQPALQLAVLNQPDHLRVTVFRAADGQRWCVHAANLGAECRFSLQGIPAGRESLHRVQSTSANPWRVGTANRAADRRIESVLPPQSLTTYTTLKPPPPP